jgi:hypothetical protein
VLHQWSAHANSQAHTWTKLTGAGIDKIQVDPVLREEMVTATRVHVGVCTGVEELAYHHDAAKYARSMPR